MASTRKLTKALTRPLTRKLTGDELQQLFLEKFKLTVSDTERLTNNFFSNTSGWSIPPFNSSTTSITDGKMVLNNAPNSGAFYFDNATEAGKSYEVKFIISDYVTGGIRIRFPEDTDRVYNANGNYTAIITANTASNVTRLTFTIVGTTTLKVDNVFVKEVSQKPPIAAFSLRKLGNVSPYACRVRRSSDNTEAQVMFDSSDRVSESSVVRNTSANLLSFSEQLNNSAWSNNQGGTAILSAITDPFGGTNSYEVSGGSQPYGGIYDTITGLLTTGKNYVYSIYLKKGTSTKTKISYYDSTLVDGYATSLRLTINWASDGEGTINAGETSTADLIATSFEEIGTDGWYRASIAFTALDTNDVQTLTLEPDRTGNGKTVLAFGAQLEEATNYFNEGTQIINDTFSSNSGWTLNVGAGINSTVGIENNSLKFNVIDNGYVRATKSITYDQNKYYILTATVNGTAGKAMRFRDDSGDLGGLTDGFDPPSGAGGKVDGRVTMTGSSQQVSFTWIPTAQSDEIIIERHSSGTYEFTVDDLLIKEYDPLYQDDFTTDTSWNTSQSGSSTVTIPSNGKGLLTIVSTAYASMARNLTYDEGSRYRVTATINGTSGNTVRFRDTFTTSPAGGLQANATGTQTEGKVTLNGSDQDISLDFTATSASDKIIFERDGFSGNGTCTIDNLIVQKLIPSTSEYISTPVVSNDGLTFTETTLDTFVGGENLIIRSTYTSGQSGTSWNAGTTLSEASSTETSPTGSQDAFKLLETATTQEHAIVDYMQMQPSQTYVFSTYIKSVGGRNVKLFTWQRNASNTMIDVFFAAFDLTNGTVISDQTSSGLETSISDEGNDWYRISMKFTTSANVDTSGSYLGALRINVAQTNGSHSAYAGDTTKGIIQWGAQLNTASLKTFQATTGTARDGNAGIVVLYNQTGGEDAIQETPAEQPLLYKEGLLVRSGSSPAWYYRDKSSGNDDVLSIPSLAGISRLDAFFVHDSGSDTTFMYPTGTTGKWGMIATQFNATTNWQNYKADDSSLVFVNGTQGSPTDRGELYNLLNGRKLVHHQNGETTSWTAFNMADYNQFGSNSLNPDDFKFSEWIFFDSNQSANRTSIEKDINDFHNIF